ncbi:hypothetical protein CEXT_83401 [Caerostris extrusa]|uniref:Uncharacterized protein n=1 Tax=Caerostris extrusa TaxID=172846 RepID=A0AAV4M7S6_CAEEX|nr:hypothetical protein CEXT_83401 [Caerostris extrusa]
MSMFEDDEKDVLTCVLHDFTELWGQKTIEGYTKHTTRPRTCAVVKRDYDLYFKVQLRDATFCLLFLYDKTSKLVLTRGVNMKNKIVEQVSFHLTYKESSALATLPDNQLVIEISYGFRVPSSAEPKELEILLKPKHVAYQHGPLVRKKKFLFRKLILLTSVNSVSNRF